MKTIGLSVYPDFDDIETMKKTLNQAKDLGYKIVFTSLQLDDLGFENTHAGLDESFMFLLEYCHQLGLEIHADINDRILKSLGASPQCLEPIDQLHIPVLRLDDGFTDEEVALMTKNDYGISIEENASMLAFPKKRIETVIKEGNINQYCACHNFFPLNETGLSYQDVHHATQLFKSYGMKVGIFIGSMYSSNDLNSVGHGIVTIEEHRYLPSHVQAMELFACQGYDYVIFGDSHPSIEELVRVSEVAHNDSKEFISQKYTLTQEWQGDYCVELPVWLDAKLDWQFKKKLTSMVLIARADQPQLLLRAEQSRGLERIEPYHPMKRHAYSITVHNYLSHRYMGELQIPLEDLPAVDNINVIGRVKPYAEHLVELLKYGKVVFVLKEE